MKCVYCGKPVMPKEAFVQMQGWERPGKGAHGLSGSSLVLREATGQLACQTCIVKLQNKVNAAQAVLV